MTVSLAKGGNISLSKTDPSLDEVMVGLGWDVRQTDGAPFDLDASAFALNTAGKVRNDMDFCFYRPENLNILGGAIAHQGDNLTGEGDGDDEQIKITLSKLPAEIDKIAIVVTIHMADERRQNFGQVTNASIRLVNNRSGQELTRYDLSEDAASETAMILGELYRNSGDWKFRAIGQGYAGGLLAVARGFGVNAQN